MGVFDSYIPDTTKWVSGSGLATLNSRGGLVYDVTVIAGSAVGSVYLFDSTAATVGSQKFMAKMQAKTQGNTTAYFPQNPPLAFTRKIYIKRMGGGTGIGAAFRANGSHMVIKVRFDKSHYRASPGG